jgi:hypothetical protein
LCLGLALISGANADERGAVAAITSLDTQTGAFIGFSSGDVLYCTRLSGCSALKGTPKAAVTAIDAPREDDSIRVWVGYDDGSVYFCTLTGGCLLQEQKATGPVTGGQAFPTARAKRRATDD